jgi:esterase/lipase
MSKYPVIISINSEIIKTINEKKKILDENYKQFSERLDKFTEELENEYIESMEKAEDTVNWLKEYTLATKMLDNYVKNFPNVKNPLNIHFTDKMQQINNVGLNSISEEALYSIMPMALLYQQILYIRQL